MTNDSDYIIFDIETTGLSPETEEIIELSAIRVSGGSVVSEFSSLVNPGMMIPDLAADITGITDDMVKGAPEISQVIKEFVAYIGDCPLVGHNIRRFDLKFIQRDVQRCLGKTLTNKTIDTLTVAKRLFPDMSSRSLESLAYHYNLSYKGAHRALADCYINKNVYDRMLRDIEKLPDSEKANLICPRCGDVLLKRRGKYGDFWGCAGFPDCRFTKDCSAEVN